MKRLLFIILILATGLASCANPKKVSISGPVSVDVLSLSRVDVGCMVENCSAHRIKLLSAKFTLHYAASGLATVLLAEPVEIAKCSTEEVAFPLRIRFSDPLAALSAINFESLDWHNLYVTGEGVVKSGMGKRKIRFRDYPVSEILTIFEAGGVSVR